MVSSGSNTIERLAGFLWGSNGFALLIASMLFAIFLQGSGLFWCNGWLVRC